MAHLVGHTNKLIVLSMENVNVFETSAEDVKFVLTSQANQDNATLHLVVTSAEDYNHHCTSNMFLDLISKTGLLHPQ